MYKWLKKTKCFFVHFFISFLYRTICFWVLTSGGGKNSPIHGLNFLWGELNHQWAKLGPMACNGGTRVRKLEGQTEQRRRGIYAGLGHALEKFWDLEWLVLQNSEDYKTSWRQTNCITAADDDELERRRTAETLQQTVQVDVEERRPNSIATERHDKKVMKSNADTKQQSAVGSVTVWQCNSFPVSESDGAALFDSYSSESEFDKFWVWQCTQKHKLIKSF